MKSILVTGGTGTFGQAFVPAALDAGYDRVCVYSRGEHRQAEMRENLNDERLRWFIGDVRDKDRLRRAMSGVDAVVHAAALKRIEVCEYDVGEMVKTNVIGTLNVIYAAMDAGVKKVIGLSTDKACDPVNAYGASKFVCERMILSANNAAGSKGPRFGVVRYGNIWKSQGSVVTIWKRLIEEGHGEVPVTDPDCTRFFMRSSEAVALVISSIRRTKSNIVTPVLPAYRIGDLAEAMGVDIRITGLPEWEKKHESMVRGETSEHARRLTVNELRGAL